MILLNKQINDDDLAINRKSDLFFFYMLSWKPQNRNVYDMLNFTFAERKKKMASFNQVFSV